VASNASQAYLFLVDQYQRETSFFYEKTVRHMWPVLLNQRIFSFFFFLLSLFAPLNGIQQLEDIF